MGDRDRDGTPSLPQHGQGAEVTAAEYVEMARWWLENINASATVHVWADEAALVEALSALLASVAKAAAEREREECARLAEGHKITTSPITPIYNASANQNADWIAEIIRSRAT